MKSRFTFFPATPQSMQSAASAHGKARDAWDELEGCDQEVVLWKRTFYTSTNFKTSQELLQAALAGGLAMRFLKNVLALRTFDPPLSIEPFA